MPETIVTYPVEEVLGFCQSVKAMVITYKTQMVAAGTDPTAMLTQLDPAVADLTAKNTVQEGLKTQMRDQTPLVETARNVAYGQASYLCDQLISAFGRTSEQAREATNLRKKLHPKNHKPAPTPAAQVAV